MTTQSEDCMNCKDKTEELEDKISNLKARIYELEMEKKLEVGLAKALIINFPSTNQMRRGKATS